MCGDARTILCDESIATVCDEQAVVVVGATSHPRCLYAWADLLLMNNWAFDDALSNDLLGAYARLAPIGGAAIVLRNPAPRHRPGSVGESLSLYELPITDDEVFDVPPGGSDWRVERDVHWTALRACCRSACGSRHSGVWRASFAQCRRR